MASHASISWLDNRDATALASWDEFIQGSVRGHYCQLSSWLQSFRAYGFDYSIVVARCPSGALVGGCGFLFVGNRLMSIMTAPIGPLVDAGAEAVAAELLSHARKRARDRHCVLLQVMPAVAETGEHPFLMPHASMSLPGFEKGAPFGSGIAPSEMNLLDFPEATTLEDWREKMLARFAGKAKRNIKTAEKRGIQMIKATSAADIQTAYSIIEDNGRQQGYSTRSWVDFGEHLQKQVALGHAIVLLARYQGAPVGAHYGVIAGRRLSYMMGGTVRMKPDLNVGYLLQWTAMTNAYLLGLRGYDLTSGGTASVGSFKASFNPTHVRLLGPRYEVLAPLRFQLLRRVYPMLRRNKATVGAALSRINKVLGR